MDNNIQNSQDFWTKNYERLAEFFKQNGHWPQKDSVGKEKQLYLWSEKQRAFYRDARIDMLDSNKVQLLKDIKFQWTEIPLDEKQLADEKAKQVAMPTEGREIQWMVKYYAVKTFKDEHGGVLPKSNLQDKEETNLYQWIYRNEHKVAKGELNIKLKELFEELVSVPETENMKVEEKNDDDFFEESKEKTSFGNKSLDSSLFDPFSDRPHYNSDDRMSFNEQRNNERGFNNRQQGSRGFGNNRRQNGGRPAFNENKGSFYNTRSNERNNKEEEIEFSQTELFNSRFDKDTNAEAIFANNIAKSDMNVEQGYNQQDNGYQNDYQNDRYQQRNGYQQSRGYQQNRGNQRNNRYNNRYNQYNNNQYGDQYSQQYDNQYGEQYGNQYDEQNNGQFFDNSQQFAAQDDAQSTMQNSAQEGAQEAAVSGVKHTVFDPELGFIEVDEAEYQQMQQQNNNQGGFRGGNRGGGQRFNNNRGRNGGRQGFNNRGGSNQNNRRYNNHDEQAYRPWDNNDEQDNNNVKEEAMPGGATYRPFDNLQNLFKDEE